MLTHTPPSPNEGDEAIVYTVAQAAKLLQVSENHVYSLCKQNLIPHTRIGKLIRIPRWGLLQFLAAESGAPLPLNELASVRAASVHVHQPATED